MTSELRNFGLTLISASPYPILLLRHQGLSYLFAISPKNPLIPVPLTMGF